MESIRENKEYEKLYIQAVKSYNYFASAYNEYDFCDLEK